MKLSVLTAISLLLACVMGSSSVEKPTATPRAALKLSLVERMPKTGALRFEALLSNASDVEIELWDPGAWPGRDTLTFVLHDPSGAQLRIVRRDPQGDQGGKPKRVTINPGESKSWSVDLLDGTWRLPEYFGAGQAQMISVQLDSAGGGIVDRLGVWKGHLASEEIKMTNPISDAKPWSVVPFAADDAWEEPAKK